MFQKPSKLVLLISFILALSVQTVTFALDGSILDSLSSLLGSASSDQSVPASSAPSQSGVKPSFQRVVVGVDGGDSQVLLGDDEVSGIVSKRTVGLGIETSGLLGIAAVTLGDTGLFVENSNGIGVLGLSSTGTGVMVTDAKDIGIYTSGSSLGFYSKGTDTGITILDNTYGGVLGTSADGTGIIGIGSQYGAQSSDGSYIGATGIGIYSASDGFIGDEYTIFSIIDATLSGGLEAGMAKAGIAYLGILDAESGIASGSTITLTGSLKVEGNDISVAKGVTIDGGSTPSYIGGNLSFLNPSSASVQIGPEDASALGINDDVHIQGNLYAEENITAQTMGNITIHEETATGSSASVSCASPETLMGCSASIDDGGYTDVTAVYPSSNYCNAERSSGDASNLLHVYAYCFEPLGDGSSDSCEEPPAPTGLSVKQDNEALTLTFSWNAVSQADSYCLKFYDSSGSEFNRVCFTGTKTSMTKDLFDFAEGGYSFSVAAQDTFCGTISPDSSRKSFTVTHPDDLMAYYPFITTFDPRTGALSGDPFDDSSGYGNNSNPSSGMTSDISTSGYSGQGAVTSSSGGYAQVSDHNSFSGSDELTLAIWVKLDSTSGKKSLISKYDSDSDGEWNFGVNGDDFFVELFTEATGCDSVTFSPSESNVITAGAWTHLAATYDDGARTLKLYVNGSKVETEYLTRGDRICNSDADMKYGIFGVSSGASGTLDEVKVYNYARTDRQICEEDAGFDWNDSTQECEGEPVGPPPVDPCEENPEACQPCDDPLHCAKVEIDFDPDVSVEDPRFRTPIAWYWEATCEPDCTMGTVEVVSDCFCFGGNCPDFMTTSGNVLTDRTSMIGGWNGIDASTGYTSGAAVGDLSVTALAYMIQYGRISTTEVAYISDQEGMVNDAKAILEASYFGSDGSLVTGQGGWTGYDTFVNDLTSVLNQIGTYDAQTQSRTQVDQRGGF